MYSQGYRGFESLSLRQAESRTYESGFVFSVVVQEGWLAPVLGRHVDPAQPWLGYRSSPPHGLADDGAGTYGRLAPTGLGPGLTPPPSKLVVTPSVFLLMYFYML